MKLLPFLRHVPTCSIFVGRDGADFMVSGGPRVDLRARGPLRRVFRAIMQAHRDQPGRALSVEEIFRAGWAGEQAARAALAAGRVYSAISQLRRAGLGEVLLRVGGGYHLEPHCCVIEDGALAARPALLAS